MSAAAPVSAAPPRLLARYFDGRSSRERVVELQLWQGQLVVRGPSISRKLPAREVQWPERTTRGRRVAHLPGGGSIHAVDDAEWDAWLRASGQRESWVVRAQQSWRGVLVALAVLLALGVFMQQWGLPWAARAVVAAMPRSVDSALEDAMRDQLDKSMMQPSRLPPEVQDGLRRAWQSALQAHAAQAGVPVVPTKLLFRHSRIGPNALALPGGTLIVTDDLVTLVGQDPQVLVGVLGHELGHVQHRHSLRMVVQVGVLGAATSLIWGDFSTVLSAVPVLLGQAHYSREAEREADAHAVQVLRAAGVSPAVMVKLFDRLAQYQACGPSILTPASAPAAPLPACAGASAAHAEHRGVLGLGFASHPAHAARMAFFQNAAR